MVDKSKYLFKSIVGSICISWDDEFVVKCVSCKCFIKKFFIQFVWALPEYKNIILLFIGFLKILNKKYMSNIPEGIVNNILV